MTTRAVLLGLLGAILICGVAYLNDAVMHQTYVAGSYMPSSVYGGLILFILIINPLLFYLSKRLALTSKELTVILVLVLAACCIPGTNLIRQLTNTLMLPHLYNQKEPGWKDAKVIEMAPKQMLADISQGKGEALDGFVQGIKDKAEKVSVPWYAWKRTLLFWLPLFFTLCIALIGLSLVVHRQWSDHEHLAYPIATFANSLLPEPGRAKSSIFSNKLFWIGAGIILVIYIYNYAQAWFPEYLIKIPTGFNLGPLASLFPAFEKAGGVWLLNHTFYFSFIGIAYLLASDVSFSLGIGPLLWTTMAGVLLGYGVSLGASLEGSSWYADLQRFMSAGAYLGLFLAILYTGRYYYYNVFRQALFPHLPPHISMSGEKQSIWGARIFIIFTALFFGQICLVGLDWPLALLYTGFTIIIFLVLSRTLAETGLFYLHPHFFPCVVIWGIFGIRALGPQMLLIMFLLTTVFIIDPRGTIMPLMVNSLKLLDLQKIKISKTALLCGVAILLGLVVGIPVTLYFQYDRGYDQHDQWASIYIPKRPFENATWIKQRLEAQGTLEEANQVSGWQRSTTMFPSGPGMLFLGLGLFLVLTFTAIRLRFPKWPLHPVMFIFWDTYLAMVCFGSFMVGWFIKMVVTKYGGIKIYQKLKPLMLGLIAGEISAAVVTTIFGLIYYLITDEKPVWFPIFPI